MAPPKRRTCAQQIVHELLVETDPGYRARRLKVEEDVRKAINSGAAMRTVAKLITLPVVVHVVYRTAAENVSDAQIKSQIKQLNLDYRTKNPDVKNVPAAWKSLVVDANIEFALATKDPSGAKSTGITRTKTAVKEWGADDAMKAAKKGGADAWPNTRYLNLWVCSLGQGLLGYAQFPGGAAKTDGVVILNTAFGTTGSVAAPFNKGRTATHEIGHFLNLRHIWGDRNDCSGNDFVTDTPPAQAANTGKPKFPHITCNNGPNGDMFMNYMDYTDDDAMFMFTVGQVARMNATLAGPRKALAAAKV
jgi:Pregnancy-associated plasma protein-A